MPVPLLIAVKAADGGLFVALFAALGEILQPKRFAGIFGASPAVALANLVVIAVAQGDMTARDAATGMIAGAIALAVACAAGVPAVRRWGAVRGSAALWAVWIVAAAAAGGPVAAAGAGPGARGVPASRRAGRPATAAGAGGGRMFAVDLAALKEFRPGALALRFAFGVAVSVVAGLIGVAAGQRAGGVMLAAPAVLPATLTIIERNEGREAAVTEVLGSVPGAVALIGFAAVAATCTAALPLAAALLCALAAWIAAAVAGYLAQGAILPAWRADVRELAVTRRAATASPAGQGSPSRP